MNPALKILSFSPSPPSPPPGGAQARLHGLMTNLARRHQITAVSLVDYGFDEEACHREMGAYCREVVRVRNPNGRSGGASGRSSYGRCSRCAASSTTATRWPALQQEVDRLLRRERFDVVNLELTYLSDLRLRQSPPGTPSPTVVVGTHELAHEIVRQVARGDVSLRVYAELNWRKLRRDEDAAFRAADGLSAWSDADKVRLWRRWANRSDGCSGDRPHGSDAAHARRELRGHFRARGGPERGRRDLQRGGRPRGAYMERPGRPSRGHRRARVPRARALLARLQPVRLAFATVFKRSPKLPHVLVPCCFESRLKPFRYTNHPARERVGWQPPLNYRECLARTHGPQLAR
jgi:hypothetical protein